MFFYKFDKNGYLLKYKGRIYVYGDLQEADFNDTYSVTFVVQSFYVAINVAIRFDLDIKQYNITNAFFYNKINKEYSKMFCKLLDGYKELIKLFKGVTNGFVAKFEMTL